MTVLNLVPTGEEKDQSTAMHIAQVAARLFAQRGFDATSVREVVEAAGVTKPTLYHHFGSKAGLAKALLHDPLTDLLRRMERVQLADLPPVEQLVGIVAEHFAFCRENPDRVRFFYALIFGPTRNSLAAELCQFGLQIRTILRNVVLKLSTTQPTPLSEPTIDGIVIALRGLFAVTSIDYLYTNNPVDESITRRLVEATVQGFLVTAHPPQATRPPPDDHKTSCD